MKQYYFSKKIVCVLMIVTAGFFSGLNAQIVITSNDMPDVDDTVRYSTTLTTGGVDFTLTGEDYTWDFTTLVPLLQQVDTFVSVLSTPFLYQLVFLYPFVATIALPQPDINFIPGFEVTEAYNYYKETSSEYHQAGVAFTVTSLPLPLRYDSPDVLYTFPMEYGSIDSCESTFELDIPDVVYYNTYRKRINTTDGWGTLVTPYGTFETLRLRSEVYQLDTLYIDSLGFGFQVPRNYVEYKWMGNGFGVPLLQVTSEGILTAVTYIDSVRTLVGIPEDQNRLGEVLLYPNPANDHFVIDWVPNEIGWVRYSLLSAEGRRIILGEKRISAPGPVREEFELRPLDLSPGIYIVHIGLNDSFAIQKLIIR
jgi:hypothetical protein